MTAAMTTTLTAERFDVIDTNADASPQRAPTAAGPLGAFEQYRQAVAYVSPLGEHEEARLLKLLAQHHHERKSCLVTPRQQREHERVRTRLVEGYQPLVIHLAKRVAWRCQHLELLDVIQEGNIGLLEAMNKYDGNHGAAAFRSWVADWIRGAMLAAYWRHERAMRIPAKTGRTLRRLCAVSAELLSSLEREPTPQELAQTLEMPLVDVYELLLFQAQQVVSLNHLLTDDALGLDALHVLAAPGIIPEINSLTLERLYLALGKLSQTARQVIALRYGFVDGQEHTQEEVADRLDLPRSQVAVEDRRARFWLQKFLAEEPQMAQTLLSSVPALPSSPDVA